MTYKVLARKCRPQTFEEVIGQLHVTRTLQNAIREGRIAHAFLFAGERGVGKTSVARILAKALNCQNGPTERPCNSCCSCSEITDGSSLDVHEIDGASNNSVEDIRALRENSKYLPSRDRYKIYIIDEVHMLSASAFNALLKTLEEPPPHVLFMFATTDPRKIPDTIISRCLRFDFKRIPVKQIARHLETIAGNEQVSISPRGLFLIARGADGSMRDAQTLFERALSYCGSEIQDAPLEEMLGLIDSRFIHQTLDAVLSKNAQACMEAVAQVFEIGADLQQFYYSLLEHMRNLIFVKTSRETSGLLDLADQDLKKLEGLAAGASPDDLYRCYRLCFSLEDEIAKSALPRIALEVCLLEMVHIQQAIPLDEILVRVESLQKQLGAGPAGPGRAARPVPKPQHAAGDAGNRAADQPRRGGAGVKDFLAFVRKEHPPTAAVLEHGEIDVHEDGAVRILLPEGSFYLSRMQEPEAEKRIQALCDDFFRKPVKLSIIATREKKKVNQQADEQVTRNESRQHALHNPVIQKLVETFNGKVIEIRTEG